MKASVVKRTWPRDEWCLSCGILWCGTQVPFELFSHLGRFPVECVKYTALIGLGYLVQTGHDQTGEGYVVSEWIVWLDKIDLTEYGMWNDRHVRRVHVP